jgi:hypothetical protein
MFIVVLTPPNSIVVENTMAFRFRREGDYIKHRTRMSNMGMQPWVNDFKHRVIGWHYDFYMKDQSRRAIVGDQHSSESAQIQYDQGRLHQTRKGLSSSDKAVIKEMDKRGIKYSDKITRYFTWRPFVPNVAPYRANSNPFCPVTSNVTGWKEAVVGRVSTDPQPKGGHHVAGTDDSVPIFPKFRG